MGPDPTEHGTAASLDAAESSLPAVPVADRPVKAPRPPTLRPPAHLLAHPIAHPPGQAPAVGRPVGPAPLYHPAPARWPGAPPGPGLPPAPAVWFGPHPARPYPPPGLLSYAPVPSARQRPTFREPLPVRPAAVWLGMIAGTVWMTLFGLIARGARGYVGTTLAAGVAAWLVALLLARFGDRGAAVGVALASGCALAVAVLVVIVRWVGGHPI